jgi:cyclase
LKPGLVKQAADYFGSQCIVISVDAKRHGNSWRVFIKGGTEETGVDALEFSRNMELAGAGELLVNSLDRDGMNTGFDLELLDAICRRVNIPVVASSGGGTMESFAEVFEKTDVDAALGASIFHYEGVTSKQIKEFLAKKGITVRQ